MYIATSAGYPEMIVYNNTERLIYIFIIYFGDALFAIGFGMIAANTEILPEKFLYLFNKIK